MKYIKILGAIVGFIVFMYGMGAAPLVTGTNRIAAAIGAIILLVSLVSLRKKK